MDAKNLTTVFATLAPPQNKITSDVRRTVLFVATPYVILTEYTSY